MQEDFKEYKKKLKAMTDAEFDAEVSRIKIEQRRGGQITIVTYLTLACYQEKLRRMNELYTESR